MSAVVQYEIEHVSRYQYASRARGCVMLLCLKPYSNERQRLLNFEIETRPSTSLTVETDCFGNARHVLNLHREHQHLEIAARCTVELAPSPPLPDRLGVDAWREIRSWGKSFVHWDFTHPSALAGPSNLLDDFVNRNGIECGDDPLKGLLQLSDTLHGSFRYLPGSTSVASPVDHILESGSGVCQDYAHAMIAIARSWGIPARYVSGYLRVARKVDGRVPDNATHAWVECLLPELGWVGFDPTNRRVVDQRHVRIAMGRDYQDVPPTQGVFQGGGETRLEVGVRMRDGSA